MQFMRAGSEKCVTWDFGMNDWSTEGCSLNATSSDGIVTCTCNHLTNFAVLVVSQTMLIIIIMVGNCFTMRPLKRNAHSHVHHCIAMLSSVISSVIAIYWN